MNDREAKIMLTSPSIINAINSLAGNGRTSDNSYYGNLLTLFLCPLCKNPFVRTSSRQVYCSRSCSRKVYDRSKQGRTNRKKYYLDNANRIKQNNNDYYYSHPEKSRAKNAISNRIHWGSLKRGSHCLICGSTDFIVAHHPDYSKPLLIQWICKSCHQKLHAQLRFQQKITRIGDKIRLQQKAAEIQEKIRAEVRG